MPLPPILRNLDNFPPGAFYWTPPPTIKHERIRNLLYKVNSKKAVTAKATLIFLTSTTASLSSLSSFSSSTSSSVNSNKEI